MEGGGLRVEGVRWMVEDGGWRVEPSEFSILGRGWYQHADHVEGHDADVLKLREPSKPVSDPLQTLPDQCCRPPNRTAWWMCTPWFCVALILNQFLKQSKYLLDIRARFGAEGLPRRR